MERDIIETREKDEQLKEDYKKVEKDAAAVMAEHEKLQVIVYKNTGALVNTVIYRYYCILISRVLFGFSLKLKRSTRKSMNCTLT